jgi:phosphoadenosine phosphosulfate reductase
MMSLDEMEIEAISAIRRINTDRAVVSVSGGKDSLVALSLSIRAGVKRAVFCDTTIGFPENIKYIKFLQRFFGVKIDVIRSSLDFFSLSSKIGFPSRRMRWCCDVFKFAPLADYASKRQISAFITGLRKEESTRRGLYELVDRNPLIPVTRVNPIISWNERDIWSYIRKYNLPLNPLYKYFKRTGCWCCPYTPKEDWEKVKTIYPELYRRLETELLKYAKKLGVPNPQKFAEQSWLNWAPRYRRWQICTISKLCSLETTYLLCFNVESDAHRVAQYLPVVTSRFKIFGKKIRVSGVSPTVLRIVIEKAVNCIGCKTCFSLCPRRALFIRNLTIAVDEQRCNRCGRCLHSSYLRFACIARNYSAIKGITDLLI